MLFSSLYLVFTPLLTEVAVSQGDFLRVLAYCVFCVGVWRAIRDAEFGRAVSDERARVAREIHDGLAQYLFAISTQATMLESGGDPATLIPQIKETAQAAQVEARFAISRRRRKRKRSLRRRTRRYIEFLTADGALEVDLEIDSKMKLFPDEQIELFRIVQEGLANARKHANAHSAEVRIEEREGRRIVTIRDDGSGFDGETTAAGQGLRNIRARITSIGANTRAADEPRCGHGDRVTLRLA